jgi:hypothetical protein
VVVEAQVGAEPDGRAAVSRGGERVRLEGAGQFLPREADRDETGGALRGQLGWAHAGMRGR